MNKREIWVAVFTGSLAGQSHLLTALVPGADLGLALGDKIADMVMVADDLADAAVDTYLAACGCEYSPMYSTCPECGCAGAKVAEDHISCRECGRINAR